MPECRVNAALDTRLQAWHAAHLQRSRKIISARHGAYAMWDGVEAVCFASNDYLGLAQHPQVIEAAHLGLARYGVGSGSAAVVSGYYAAHADLEEALADFFGGERALLFTSGYLANQAVITGLLQKNDSVVADKLCHASILEAAHCAAANLQRYRHADPASAARYLRRVTPAQHSLLVTEGLFGMDGDLAPLSALASLLNPNQHWLLVDDAHGVGVLGASGRGSVEAAGLSLQENHVLVGTFGKALGGSGAFLVGQHTVLEHILQFAKSYLYTTAMPPALALANHKSLSLLRSAPELRQRLQDNIAYFQRIAAELNLPVLPSSTPVQIVVVGDTTRAMRVGQLLLARGIWVAVIRPPTVPPNTARLRISITALHDRSMLDRLADALQHVIDQTRDA